LQFGGYNSIFNNCSDANQICGEYASPAASILISILVTLIHVLVHVYSINVKVIWRFST
jgi:hypothetical protein